MVVNDHEVERVFADNKTRRYDREILMHNLIFQRPFKGLSQSHRDRCDVGGEFIRCSQLLSPPGSFYLVIHNPEDVCLWIA